MKSSSNSPIDPSRSALRKLLVSLLIVGLLAGVIGVGVYSAFSATTTNSGNQITTGTVAIGRDYSQPFYLMTNAKPGDTTSKCTRITYSGSLTADVRMYLSSGAIAPTGQWTLQIERVTIPGGNVAGDCTGYTNATSLYNGDLATFSTTKTDFSSGLDIKGSTWSQNNVVGLRVTMTQADDSTANAHTSAVDSGSHTFTWEARNT